MTPEAYHIKETAKRKFAFSFLPFYAILPLKEGFYMNIPELSTALANVQLNDQVSIAVLDQAMESSEDAGASLISMMNHSMELSVNPHIGGNIDLLI